jgi:hypothetical protein
MKVFTQVITVQNDSSRSRHMRAELSKLEPWCQAVIRQFNSPCADYQGKSDGNLCVQENLYQNHQRCAQHILESGAPYGLVLESDFKVQLDGQALARTMDAAVEWIEHHPAIWDVFLLGGAGIAIDTDHECGNDHVVRVRRYDSKTHAVIYSKAFCHQLVDTEWPGSHFDLYWSEHRQDIRMFKTRDMPIGVHHVGHSREMAQNNWLAHAMPMDFNAKPWKVVILTVFCVSVLLMAYICVKMAIAGMRLTKQ